MKDAKSKAREPKRQRPDRNAGGGSESRITPGAAEGDLETVEQDLKIQDKRKGQGGPED